MLPNTLDELHDAMKSTEQMKNLTVYEHGEMVNNEYVKLMSSLRNGVIPESTDKVLLDVYNKVHELILDDETVRRYQVYHDCGKPYCISKTDDGKVQFPEHEQWSCRVWTRLFGTDFVVQDLMRLDMVWHTISLENAEAFWNYNTAPTLFFSAWAEILANCQMFGGPDSTSYKIKRKKLLRCAKKFLK